MNILHLLTYINIKINLRLFFNCDTFSIFKEIVRSYVHVMSENNSDYSFPNYVPLFDNDLIIFKAFINLMISHYLRKEKDILGEKKKASSF